MRNARVRRMVRYAAISLGIAFAVWMTVGIMRAGNDIPQPPTSSTVQLHHGHAEGHRINGRAWTLDCEKIAPSPDDTFVTLTNVYNGELYKHGKPYMSVRAASITANLVSNDFTAAGPVTFSENDGKSQRSFTSNRAVYEGGSQQLTLPNAATVKIDGHVVQVTYVKYNIRTGALTVGRITGLY
jgi:hypothetical protein